VSAAFCVLVHLNFQGNQLLPLGAPVLGSTSQRCQPELLLVARETPLPLVPNKELGAKSSWAIDRWTISYP
jgi:hypothetical protein